MSNTHRLLLLVLASCIASRALADPATYTERYETRRNFAVMAAGLAVVGALYVAPGIAGLADGDRLEAIPIAGAIHDAVQNTGDWGAASRAVFIIDAIGQTAGIAMTLAGALTRRKVRVLERVVAR